MDDNEVPAFWPFLYDRIVVHWRTTVTGLCATALVVVPVLQANGVVHRGLTICGALAVAATTALSKDR